MGDIADTVRNRRQGEFRSDMGKLVRDRIPEIIEESGRVPVTRVLTEEEYVIALLDKLFEEASELRAASPTERVEEAADVFEVLSAIVATSGSTWQAVLEAAAIKRRERGGFTERIWLDSW